MQTIQVGSSQMEPYAVIESAQKAAGWFGTIVIFSAINTGLNLFHTGIQFVVGLGASQVVDAGIAMAVEKATPPASTILVLIGVMMNLFLLGIFAMAWWLSKLGYRWAYVIGTLLYLLDTFLFVLVRDIVGLGFHVFFLLALWGGYRYVQARPEAERMLAQPAMARDTVSPSGPS